MKKFFLLFSVSLFLGSCSDLALKEEEAMRKELPADFDWVVYAEINKDVKMSQVFFQIKEEKPEPKTSADTANLRGNCINLLSDFAFAEKIYLDYAGCPRKGWDNNKACTGGIYANNVNYNTIYINPNTNDTTYSCKIGLCWRGGWDELRDLEIDISKCKDPNDPNYDADYYLNNKVECDYVRTTRPLEPFLSDSLIYYKNRPRSISALRERFYAIDLMCSFVPLADDVAAANSRLESLISNIDPTLIEQHYFLIGRNDGRPYKYCDCLKGQCSEERSVEKHSIKLTGYYDYSQHTFCMNTSDDKIYVAD
jgi:hypothetical protein